MTEAQKAAFRNLPADKRAATEDFSDAIEQTMDRQPDEQVHCVRVFDDRYRCNWWVRDKTNDWLAFTTGSIRKSIFLKVTMKADKLIIEDMSTTR